MQNKLHQLIISALKRNDHTHMLNLGITVKGYDVIVSGQVISQHQAYEVIQTIESVSPHLRVFSQLAFAQAELLPAF